MVTNEALPPASFLGIPAELRLQIYEYTLPDLYLATIWPDHPELKGRVTALPDGLGTKIGLTCKKLYDEYEDHRRKSARLVWKLPFAEPPGLLRRPLASLSSVLGKFRDVVVVVDTSKTPEYLRSSDLVTLNRTLQILAASSCLRYLEVPFNDEPIDEAVSRWLGKVNEAYREGYERLRTSEGFRTMGEAQVGVAKLKMVTQRMHTQRPRKKGARRERRR